MTPRSIVDTSLTEVGGQNLSDSNPLVSKYSCSRCGRSYLHQATLVRHQRYECGISASYPCQLCGRKFKRRDVLKGHMEKCMNKSNLPPTVPNTTTMTTLGSPIGPRSGLGFSGSPIPITTMSMTSMVPFGP